jgi:hypothetical protein
LQTQVDGVTQTFPALSPGVQIGGCAASQVTLHFGQGGGPSTLQEEGFVMSQPGVGEGLPLFDLPEPVFDWTFALLLSLPTAAIGRSTATINQIVTANILSFINSFYLSAFEYPQGHPSQAPSNAG